MTDTPQQPPDLLPHEVPLPPRWDLYIAAVFFVVGAGIIAGAVAMPTFYERLQQIYTAPGLVPGFYGVVIALLSVWLGVRAISRGALREGAATGRAPKQGDSNFRLLLAGVLCIVFAVVLVGHMPFWLAITIFITAFITLFEWLPGIALQRRLINAAQALAIGLGTGIVVTLLFERLFLVRLP